MWALGVVEDEPVGEFLVEQGQVGKEQVFVVIDEGFLEGAVEAFDMGVHPGAFGVGIPALDMPCLDGSGEVFFELAAIVREHDLGGLWQQGEHGFQGGLGVATGFAGQGQCQGKTACWIDEGDDVASDAITDAFDGIHGQALQWSGPAAFGLAWLGGATGLEASQAVWPRWGMAHPVRGAGHDAADGGCRGKRHTVLLTPRREQEMELVFAEVGMRLAELTDFSHESGIGPGGASAPGRRGACRQGGWVAPCLAQGAFLSETVFFSIPQRHLAWRQVRGCRRT